MTESLRVVYAGTPDFAVPALDALVAAGHDIPVVYTQPDRPAGRGRRPRPSPVKARALAHGLAVRQPERLNDAAEQATLAALAPDVMVVAAYGLILPRAVLDIPRLGCLNIHASLLPRWRGAAPIQRAILAGDTETGVCLMKMAEGLDTGPVIECLGTAIGPADTGGSLHDRLAALGACLMREALSGYADGSLPARPQPAAGVTYARKLSKAEARIDWSRGAAELERMIRAFDPWPVAHTEWQGQPLRVWRAAVVDRPPEAPAGTVLAAGPEGVDVAAGDGVLRLIELQAAGRRRQPVHEFLNGHRLATGHRFP